MDTIEPAVEPARQSVTTTLALLVEESGISIVFI